MRAFVCVVVCLIYVCTAEGSTAQRKKEVLIERLKQLLTLRNEQKENIALGKDAYQSSTALWGAASRAVDGDTNSNYYDLSCTYTASREHQYWAVDLGGMYSVGEVAIYNRMDWGSWRLQNTEVYAVPYKPRTWNVSNQYFCGEIASSTQDVRKIVVQCGGLRAMAVLIRKTDTESLTLCEVEVFKQTNLAKGGDTYQSSTGHNGVPSRAVDGNTDSNYYNNSCSHTHEPSDHQYWYVDLGAEYLISGVVIYNRMDSNSQRLQNTEVYIYPERPTSWDMDIEYLCGKIEKSTLYVRQVKLECAGLRGQYVAIRKTDSEPLTLCEVKVFN